MAQQLIKKPAVLAGVARQGIERVLARLAAGGGHDLSGQEAGALVVDQVAQDHPADIGSRPRQECRVAPVSAASCIMS